MFKKKDEPRPPRTELDELWGLLKKLALQVDRLETDWQDTKDQVRRSYQRLEKANQRAEAREMAVTEDDGAGHQIQRPETPDEKQRRLWRGA